MSGPLLKVCAMLCLPHNCYCNDWQCCIYHLILPTPSHCIVRVMKEMLEINHGLISTVIIPGHIAQSVTCLATDACLTAIPGVARLIPAWSHTFVELIMK